MRSFAYNHLSQYLAKAGGEGSRGGHVVGHTKSGKPIYEVSRAHGPHANTIINTTSSKYGAADGEKKNRLNITRIINDHEDYDAHDHNDAAEAHRLQAKNLLSAKYGRPSRQNETLAEHHRVVSDTHDQAAQKLLAGKEGRAKTWHASYTGNFDAPYAPKKTTSNT